MEKYNLNSLESIDKAIQYLYALKSDMIKKSKLTDVVKKYDWVIIDNKYYQFVEISLDKGSALLSRHNTLTPISVKDFNKKFRLANKSEVEQHIEFLNKKCFSYLKDFKSPGVGIDGGCAYTNHFRNQLEKINNIKKVTSVPAFDWNGTSTPKNNLPEFYMVTVKGLTGTKFRHESYDAAEKEAKRLAKSENHRAHIMGVVAIVDPIVEVSFEVTRK
jgi:hypothetical protein